jgi:hypothetical protein
MVIAATVRDMAWASVVRTFVAMVGLVVRASPSIYSQASSGTAHSPPRGTRLWADRIAIRRCALSGLGRPDVRSRMRLSEHRELQESDLFLLRWTRSLPTVIPDGPEITIRLEM